MTEPVTALRDFAARLAAQTTMGDTLREQLDDITGPLPETTARAALTLLIDRITAEHYDHDLELICDLADVITGKDTLSRESDPADSETEGPVCACPVPAGATQLVLINIEYGEVTGDITCATCQAPLPYPVDTELIEATSIPLAMTYHDLTIHYPEPEYGGCFRLTVPAASTIEP